MPLQPVRSPRSRLPASVRARGFALLITITLVAFLVLVLVSLATLTRVETRVAGNSQQVGQARQNALMALNIALGQLQRYAGPDQRATAPSDAGVSVVNPNRSDVQRHWTGVWVNNTPTAETAERELLTWLVSGNEDLASPQALHPQTPIDDPVSPASDTVWLVQDATVAFTGAPSATNPDPRIKLPKQDIKSDTVPGLAPVSGGHTVGRYAWWVGDESVKARVNLADPHATATPAAARGFSFVTSQRAGVSRIDRAESVVALGGLYPSPGDGAFDDVGKVGDLGQFAFLTADPADAGLLREALRGRFHALTAHSFSVLANAADGGLKQDLSAGLAANPYARGLLPDDDTVFPLKPGESGYVVPTWGLLRDWAAGPQANGATISPRPLVAPDQSRLGLSSAVIGPVVTYAGLGMGFSLAPHEADATDIPILFNLHPAVVLWNPYTVPLAAADYTIGIGLRGADDQFTIEREDGTAVWSWSMPAITSVSNDAYVRFKIASPVIPAGASLVFTLPPAGPAPTVPVAYQPGLSELINGINPASNVVIDTGATAATPDEVFTIRAPNITREMDLVLAEFDPAGQLPRGVVPPVGAPHWYQAVSRVTFGNNVDWSRTDTLPVEDGTQPRLPAYAKDFLASFSTENYAMQWIAHANPRAPLLARTRFSASGGGEPNPTFRYRKLPLTATETTVDNWPRFNYGTLPPRASAGRSLDNNGTPVDVTLFELPDARLGLLSLGQLQHAPLSLLSAHPAYAVGNSLADIRLSDRTATSDNAPLASTLEPTRRMETHHDLSWHLNRALWDRYFFSTVPSGNAPGVTVLPGGGAQPAWTQGDIDAGTPLPNARLRYHRRDGVAPSVDRLVKTASPDSDPFNQAAAHLLLAGGFNVNSTSEQAWRAVLAGTWGLDYDPANRNDSETLEAAFPRFSVPTGDDDPGDPWRGYRQLDDAQLRELARNIVVQVKLRGPFLSLSDFVNRGLSNDATGLKGALQAAIDATTSGAGAANPANLAPFNQDLISNTNVRAEYVRDHMRNDDSGTGSAAHRSRSAFAPKFLTQADVLTAIGPTLTVRADTFLVRAYGETVNPLLSPADDDYVIGRAWAEAVVQRLPDHLNSNQSQSPEEIATGDNAVFGRRFQIVSFRWLSPDEI
ncbi:MAG: hypothetical protein ABII82_20780 [Verrucomicrobiota bacterium]